MEVHPSTVKYLPWLDMVVINRFLIFYNENGFVA